MGVERAVGLGSKAGHRLINWKAGLGCPGRSAWGKAYSQPALDGVRLDVYSGERLVSDPLR